MKNLDEILIQHLSEQIALEEHLYNIIEEQILEINESNFADAKNILTEITGTLELHFESLNKLLGDSERAALSAKKSIATNGLNHTDPIAPERKHALISKILRDDYSALNLITISNTLLHTIALALDKKEVASVALKHLENLAPFVVKIGELLPEIATRELRKKSSKIDLLVAQTALKNARLVWQQFS